MDPLDKLDLMAPREIVEHKVNPDPKVFQDHKDLPDPLEHLVKREVVVSVESLENKVQEEKLVALV